METKQKLRDALKNAMRENDEARKRTTRLALSTIQLAEVEKGGPLEEPELIVIIQKEIKARREAIQDAQKAQRPDLVAAGEEDIRILETFLPEQLSTGEIQKLVQEAITETGANTTADMKKVLDVVLPRVQGRARGDQVSQVARAMLTKS